MRILGLLGLLLSDAWLLSVLVLSVVKSLGLVLPWRWLTVALSACRAELKPFVVPGTVVAFVGGQLSAPGVALVVVIWWLRRNEDDDDRWKRRGRAAANKVAELGGRLVVVPAAARVPG